MRRLIFFYPLLFSKSISSPSPPDATFTWRGWFVQRGLHHALCLLDGHLGGAVLEQDDGVLVVGAGVLLGYVHHAAVVECFVQTRLGLVQLRVPALALPI